MRKLLLVMALLTAAIFFGFSGTSARQRADLTYVNSSDIHTLDPVRMSWITDFRVALNLWEGLTTWDAKTVQPIGGAAEFPPRVSDDGLSYTFSLRGGARWSNGDRLVAEDFVRGWRRGLEPGSATDYTFLLTDHIAGAEEYVGWRREGVAALSALARLRDGWSIPPAQMQQLMRSENAEVIRNHVRSESTTDVPADAQTGSVDWRAAHEAVFTRHFVQFEERFAAVGVSAEDERTFVVRLRRPCAYFLDLLAMPIFLPCHKSIELLRERCRDAPFTDTGLVVYDAQWTKPDYHRRGYPGLVTNGPYRLAEWTFKRRARLEANPFYHSADAVTCRTVDMLVYDNLSAALMAYESGYVDLLPDLGVPYVHELVRRAQSGERTDFHLAPVLATYFFNFNCDGETVDGRPNPFRDPRVRRAFSLAVDKEQLVYKVRGRGDRLAQSFVPSGGIAGYTPPAAPPRNVDEARRLLTEAGFPSGVGLPPIGVLYTHNDERLCQSLAKTWETELGVRVDLRVKESKTFGEDKSARRFMIARGNWFADYNDPTTFLDCLQTGNGNNDSGYANTEYDALLAKAAGTTDVRARFDLLAQAESIVVTRDFPILPILHFTEPIAMKPYVQGVYANHRLWFPFRFAQIKRTEAPQRAVGSGR